MRSAKNRQEASDQFWTDVKDLLTQKYGHSGGRAEQGIDDYRKEADQKFPQVVYNQGEEQTAKAIDGVIRAGALPTPKAS